MSFKDHIVQHPDRYKMTKNEDGTITLVPTWVENPSEVVQQGTPLNAETIGGIDKKIEDTNQQLAETSEKIKYTSNAKTPLIVPTYEGSNQTVHPKVEYFPSGWNGYKYWLAHTPYPSSTERLENPSISVSNDGVKWFDPPGMINPLDAPTASETAAGGHYSDTHFVFKDNVLECWYRYNTSVIDQIWRRTSANGTTWSARELMHEFTGAKRTFSPAIIWDENKYKMWYVDENFTVIYKESADGMAWNAAQPVSITYENGDFRAWHLDVIRDGSNYELLLNAGLPEYPAYSLDRKELLFGVSTSPTQFVLRSIMKPTDRKSGRWDNEMLYRACLVKIDGGYQVFYSARSQDNKWHIGLAYGDINALIGYAGEYTTGDLVNINGMYPNGEIETVKGNGVTFTNGTAKVRARTGGRANTLDIKRPDTGDYANVEVDAVYADQTIIKNPAGTAIVAARTGGRASTLDVKRIDNGDYGNIEVDAAYGKQTIIKDSTGALVISARTGGRANTLDIKKADNSDYAHAEVDALYAKQTIFKSSGGASVVRNITSATRANTLEVRRLDNGTLGNLEADGLYIVQILPSDAGGQIEVKGRYKIVNTDANLAALQVTHMGVGGIRLAVAGSNRAKITTEDGVQTALLDLSGLVFTAGFTVPAVEGAVRYNATTKKHEGYDGTTWNPFY